MKYKKTTYFVTYFLLNENRYLSLVLNIDLSSTISFCYIIVPIDNNCTSSIDSGIDHINGEAWPVWIVLCNYFSILKTTSSRTDLSPAKVKPIQWQDGWVSWIKILKLNFEKLQHTSASTSQQNQPSITNGRWRNNGTQMEIKYISITSYPPSAPDTYHL